MVSTSKMLTIHDKRIFGQGDGTMVGHLIIVPALSLAIYPAKMLLCPFHSSSAYVHPNHTCRSAVLDVWNHSLVEELDINVM